MRDVTLKNKKLKRNTKRTINIILTCALTLISFARCRQQEVANATLFTYFTFLLSFTVSDSAMFLVKLYLCSVF